MRTTRLIAILVGLAAIAMVAADAQAIYHPGMGTFMSRDPGAGGANRIGAGGAPAATGSFIPRDPTGSNQYADGMNLYQYVRSNPGRYLDPSGLGTYKRGKPQRPDIRHDNGFLDRFEKRDPTWGDYWELAKWKAKLNGAELLRPDLDDATAAYRHFLYGNGADYYFSYDEYVDEDASGGQGLKAEIADAQRFAEKPSTKAEEKFQITGSAVDPGYPAIENWQKAIGGHTIWGAADVEVTCNPKTNKKHFTLYVTVNAEDRYTFNPGQADIATGIPDSANGRFEITGLAHQFDQFGKSHRRIEWDEGDIQNAKVSKKGRDGRYR